jgi:hypothetical protein
MQTTNIVVVFKADLSLVRYDVTLIISKSPPHTTESKCVVCVLVSHKLNDIQSNHNHHGGSRGTTDDSTRFLRTH